MGFTEINTQSEERKYICKIKTKINKADDMQNDTDRSGNSNWPLTIDKELSSLIYPYISIHFCLTKVNEKCSINTIISKISDHLMHPSVVMIRNLGASLLGSEPLLSDIVTLMILFSCFHLCNGVYRNSYLLKGLLKRRS